MTDYNRPAAIVTGGAVRMGRAIALALADAGYDIALHYNSSAGPAETTAGEIRARGVDCKTFPLDLSQVDTFARMLSAVLAAFPRLSVLVNNASSYDQAPIASTDVAMFDTQFAVNLRAPFFLTQQFAALVRRGNVVNILDNKIGFHQYKYAAYLLSKKALAEFTVMAALEFAPDLRVNAVAPGVVLPATTRSPAYVAWRVQGIPLQMQGSPAHIAQAVLSLIDNPFVTGQVLTVDGGENKAYTGQNAADFPGGADAAD